LRGLNSLSLQLRRRRNGRNSRPSWKFGLPLALLCGLELDYGFGHQRLILIAVCFRPIPRLVFGFDLSQSLLDKRMHFVTMIYRPIVGGRHDGTEDAFVKRVLIRITMSSVEAAMIFEGFLEQRIEHMVCSVINPFTGPVSHFVTYST